MMHQLGLQSALIEACLLRLQQLAQVHAFALCLLQGATRVDAHFMQYLANYLGTDAYTDWATDTANAEDVQVSAHLLMPCHAIRQCTLLEVCIMLITIMVLVLCVQREMQPSPSGLQAI